jgi:hypothetical protein
LRLEDDRTESHAEYISASFAKLIDPETIHRSEKGDLKINLIKIILLTIFGAR